MKNLLKYLLVLIIGLVIGAFIFKSCYKPEVPDNTQRIKELTSERDSLTKENKALLKANDSLSTIKEQIKIRTVKEIIYIDSLLKKDSSFALSVFRKNLTLWGWLPDKADLATRRELGLAAKSLNEGYGFKLRLNLCEQQSKNKDTIIKDKDFIIAGNDELLDIQKLETEKWKTAYEDESAWYHSDYLWFGGGVLVTTAIILLTGLAK